MASSKAAVQLPDENLGVTKFLVTTQRQNMLLLTAMAWQRPGDSVCGPVLMDSPRVAVVAKRSRSDGHA